MLTTTLEALSTNSSLPNAALGRLTSDVAAPGFESLTALIFGLSRWMPLSLLCLAVLGAADMFSVYVRQSLIQLYTPDQMRGRVGAVSSLFIALEGGV